MNRINVIDSHTAGEPTRIVVSGGPQLKGGSVAEKLEYLRKHHDVFRSACSGVKPVQKVRRTRALGQEGARVLGRPL